jgi:hypothetical protein
MCWALIGKEKNAAKTRAKMNFLKEQVIDFILGIFLSDQHEN